MTTPPRRRPDRPDYRNATDIHDILHAGRLTTLEEVETVRLWKVLHSNQASIRSSSGGGNPTGEHPDPTANVALSTDPTRHALRRLEHCVTQYRAAASELAELRRTWLREGADGPTAEPQQKEPDGCEIMARVGVWEPGRVTTLPPALRKFANGRGTMRLSRWAADYVNEFRALPTDEQAEQHAQGRRVYVKATATTRKGGK